MKAKLDFVNHKGEYEISDLASSRSKIFLVRINNKHHILKVYNRDNQSQIRAREISQRLSFSSKSYLNNYPQLKTIIYNSLAIDYGNAAINGDQHYAALFNYLPGTNLHDAVEDGSISGWVTKGMIKQLAIGVGTIHALNIVHSDLTLPNLLINEGNLSIIDLDGGGIIEDRGWKLKPLVAGRQILGLPNAPEASNGKVGKGLDLWWMALISFILATKGVNPFFFLKNAEYESLKELKQVLDEKESGWPPPYKMAKKHSMFNHKVKENHMRYVLKEVNKVLPSIIFYRTFVTGLDQPSERSSARKYLIN